MRTQRVNPKKPSAGRRAKVGAKPKYADPSTTPAQLEKLIKRDPRALSNPNISPALLRKHARKFPVEVGANPALDLISLDDPTLFSQIMFDVHRGWRIQYASDLTFPHRGLLLAECLARGLPDLATKPMAAALVEEAIAEVRRMAAAGDAMARVAEVRALQDRLGVEIDKMQGWVPEGYRGGHILFAARDIFGADLNPNPPLYHMAIFKRGDADGPAFSPEAQAEVQWQAERIQHYYALKHPSLPTGVRPKRSPKKSTVGAAESQGRDTAPFSPSIEGMAPSPAALTILMALSPALHAEYLPLFELEQLSDPALAVAKKLSSLDSRISAGLKLLTERDQRLFAMDVAEMGLPYLERAISSWPREKKGLPGAVLHAVRSQQFSRLDLQELHDSVQKTLVDKLKVGSGGWLAAKMLEKALGRMAPQAALDTAQAASKLAYGAVERNLYTADRYQQVAMLAYGDMEVQVLNHLIRRYLRAEGRDAVGGDLPPEGNEKAPFSLSKAGQSPSPRVLSILMGISPKLRKEFKALIELEELSDPSFEATKFIAPAYAIQEGIKLLTREANHHLAVDILKMVLPLLDEQLAHLSFAQRRIIPRALQLLQSVSTSQEAYTQMAAEVCALETYLDHDSGGYYVWLGLVNSLDAGGSPAVEAAIMTSRAASHSITPGPPSRAKQMEKQAAYGEMEQRITDRLVDYLRGSA